MITYLFRGVRLQQQQQQQQKLQNKKVAIVLFSYFAAKVRWGGPIRSPTVSGYRVIFIFIYVPSLSSNDVAAAVACMMQLS